MKILNVSYEDIPAPKLTSSFTYNEKLSFLRGRSADYITIGSSASLDNLSSQAVIQHFNSSSYLNMSSFGFTNRDIFKLLKVYTQIHKPKVLIMNSSVLDYTFNDKVVEEDDLKAYLQTTGYTATYLKYINLYYLLTELQEKKRHRDIKISNTNQSLIYDRYGGVVVKKDTAAINFQKRHLDFKQATIDLSHGVNLNIVTKKIYDHNFNYLDSISIFCKKNNIDFYFFQNPMSESMYQQLPKDVTNMIVVHTNREKNIVLNGGHHFVNAFEISWNDSLFSDYQHMNSNGAEIFTRYCLEKSK